MGGNASPAPTGTCLFIAGNGKRCTRPALVSGFCARHDPDAMPQPMMPFLRLAAAVAVLLTFLWPIVADLLRQIRTWMK